MRHHHPSSDADCIRNQSMKGLSRVVLGSIAGAVLGAASFFAVDGLIPEAANAQSYNPLGRGYVQDTNPLGRGYVQDTNPLGRGYVQDTNPLGSGYVQDKGVMGF